jgi:hypothetical protein
LLRLTPNSLSQETLLEEGYTQERKSNAGRKRIDPLILFKMLILKLLFNLSDEELEFQVNDRRSFEEFVGLGVMNNIPDATTIAFFRERLRKAEVIEKLFEGISKNSVFVRAGQRDPLRDLEWMKPKTTSEPIFRGALMHLYLKRAVLF